MPVFLAGAWQDEQTGGYFANMLDRFTGNDDVWFTAQNGGHTDPLDPSIFARWVEFLSIFVAQEVPTADADDRHRGVDDRPTRRSARTAPLPPDRFAGVTSYAEAKAIFEQFPRVRILFENGGGADRRRARAALRGRLPVVADPRNRRNRRGTSPPAARSSPTGAERRAAPTRTSTTRRTARHDAGPVGRAERAVGEAARLALEPRRRPAPRSRTRPRRSRPT